MHSCFLLKYKPLLILKEIQLILLLTVLLLHGRRYAAAADKAQGEVDALEGVVAGVKATAEAATKAELEAEASRADAAEKANAAAIQGYFR